MDRSWLVEDWQPRSTYRKWRNNFIKKNHLAAIFLDIKGTYDNVNLEILINNFIELNLPRNLILYITITVRYIQFINYPGNINPACKDLPQGSILSPMFSIYINKIVITPEIKVLKFADDIAISVY